MTTTGSTTIDLGALIVKFLTENGIAGLVLGFLAWFLTTRVWPWFTTILYPNVAKDAERRNTTQAIIATAVSKLELLAEQMIRMLERHDDRLARIEQTLAIRADIEHPKKEENKL